MKKPISAPKTGSKTATWRYAHGEKVAYASIRRNLWAGFAGACFLAVVEFLFHFVPWETARPLLAEHAFLQLIPAERMIIGAGLLLVAGPLYYAGYWGIGRWLRQLGRSPVLFLALSVWMIHCGLLWMGGRLWHWSVLQAGTHAPLAVEFSDAALATMRVLLFFSSAALVWQLRGTQLGTGMWFWNPFVLWALVFLAFFLWPAAAWPFLVIAFNAAHVLFFGYLLRTRAYASQA